MLRRLRTKLLLKAMKAIYLTLDIKYKNTWTKVKYPHTMEHYRNFSLNLMHALINYAISILYLMNELESSGYRRDRPTRFCWFRHACVTFFFGPGTNSVFAVVSLKTVSPLLRDVDKCHLTPEAGCQIPK